MRGIRWTCGLRRKGQCPLNFVAAEKVAPDLIVNVHSLLQYDPGFLHGGLSVRRAGREQGVELRFLEGVRARFPDDPLVLKALGDLYTRVGRIEDGLAVDRRLVRLCPEEEMVWYNLACSCALAGRTDLTPELEQLLGFTSQVPSDDRAWRHARAQRLAGKS